MLDYILAALEGFGKFFNMIGTSLDFISSGWKFAEFWTDFFSWIIDFGQRVAAFFAG